MISILVYIVTSSKFQPAVAELLAQLTHINEHVIGRSVNQKKLFEYLVLREKQLIEEGTSHQQGPKEVELAIEVFGKTADFNSSEDSIVRVNISNLRKKLENYYMKTGKKESFYISIPVGGYRLLFTENVFDDVNTSQVNLDRSNNKSKRLYLLCIILFLSLVLSLVFNAFQALGPSEHLNIQPDKVHSIEDAFYSTGIWADFVSSKRYPLIVLGDFHHFVQISKTHNRRRVILDPAIRDDNELKRYLSQQSEQSFITQNSPLKLVSKGSIIAVKNVLSIFPDRKNKNIITASELSAYHMRQHDIFYIGPLNAMGVLSQYFKGSNFLLSEDKSALVHKYNKQRFLAPDYLSEDYVDYGLFAKLDGPRGNKIYIMSSFSDPALMQVSWFSTSKKDLSSPEFEQFINDYGLSSYNNFEVLFKVPSVNGIDMRYELVTGGKVDSKKIWEATE